MKVLPTIPTTAIDTSRGGEKKTDKQQLRRARALPERHATPQTTLPRQQTRGGQNVLYKWRFFKTVECLHPPKVVRAFMPVQGVFSAVDYTHNHTTQYTSGTHSTTFSTQTQRTNHLENTIGGEGGGGTSLLPSYCVELEQRTRANRRRKTGTHLIMGYL